MHARTHKSRESRAVVEALESRRMLTVDVGVGPGIHLASESIALPGGEETYQLELLKTDDLVVQIDFSHAMGNLDVEVMDDTMAVIGSGTSTTDNETVTLTGLVPGTYFIRVFAVGANTNTFDLSVDPAGTSSTRVFYVNDGDTTGDVYALAVGDDLNDGLTPFTPKATAQSVYDDYDIGPDDLVLIDTGSYSSALLIEAADEGANIAGSPNDSNLTAYTAISLDDADFNLIYGLRFIGSGTGIYAYGDGVDDSTNNVFRSNYFDGRSTGIRINSGDSDLVEGNTFVNMGSYGVRLTGGGPNITVRDNDIAGATYGVYGVGASTLTLGATVEGNTITGGTQGVYLTSYTTGCVVYDNAISGFASYGIYASHEATIDANTVTGGDTGIFSQNAATTITGNTVSGAVTGIYNHAGVIGGTDWSAGQPNDIYGNSTGILLGYSTYTATARYNLIHGNIVGIETSRNSDIHHNVIYRNTGDGIRVDNDYNVTITNNTIYTASGDGVVVRNSSYDVTLTNNIIWTEAGYDLYVATDSQRGFVSDYNNLYTTGTGKVVWWQKDFTDLFDWQVEADYDTHSIGYTAPAPGLDDPIFVNLAGDDYHLQNVVSTSIDAGDPASDFSDEPVARGDRINLGAYGGTTEAALSRTAYVDIDHPNYYTDWEATTPNVILWHAFNITGNVDIDVYQVGGGKVADIDIVPVTNGSYSWSPASSGIAPNATDRYFIRITSVTTPTATDDSREGFSVPPSGPSFYIDDTDVANTDDEYTPAAHGDNRNTGKTVLDPKANLLPMLRNYDLGPGDTVYIDTGDYIHVRNVLISGELGIGDDEGATFTGPTDLGKVAQIDRANPHDDSTNIELYDADFVTLRNLTLTGAERGLWVHSGSTNFTGENLIVGSNSEDGIVIESDAEASHVNALTAMNNGRYGIHISTTLATLSDSFAYNNTSYGMYFVNLDGAVVSNNTVYDNGSYGIYVTNTTAYDTVVIEGNDVYNNTSRGISASTNVRVVGNTVYDHTGVNEIGIEVGGGAIAEDNVVYGNYNGITTNHTGHIIDNRVYNNSNFGIYACYVSTVTGNHVYSNTYGIRTDWWSSSRFYGEIANNLVYDSAVTGIHIEGGGNGSRIQNNTVYETAADGIRVQDSSQYVRLRDNIIWVDSDHGIYVANDSQTGFDSDYNVIYPTGTAVTGYWQSTTHATLQEWRLATFGDAHSQARDPLFVDPAGGDGLLGYTGGVDHGVDDDFHLQSSSPAIDAGDVQSYYLTEPNSGGRVNQGAYGNTDEATSSPVELVQVLFPNGDERLEEGSDYLVQWRVFGLTLNDTIALINAGGATSDNWLVDKYSTSGSTTYTTTAIDTSGVTDAAPMEVYQTYRQASSGIGGTLDYHLAVPDGTYALRLHFAEHQYTSAGSRVFDIFVQGALEIDNYDIYADAGDRYVATTQTVAVTAAGGAGIDIQCVNETSARAILAAIELTQATAAGVASPTVDLDLSTDTGGSWNPIATNLTMDHYGRGEHLWTAGPLTAGMTALIRATADDASMPTDVSDDPFEIVEPVNIYYVNDAFNNPVGDWTTNPGSDLNDGRTPATPMATISAVLSTYDLELGDVIKVDDGTYSLLNNIIITAGDAGVQIEGYHDVLYPGRQALLDRGNIAQNAIDIQATDITLSHLWITGAYHGVNATDADDLRIEHGMIYGNDRYGVLLDTATDRATVTGVTFDGVASMQNHGIYAQGPEAILTDNEFYGHSSYGLYVYDADQVTVTGNVSHDNSYGIYGHQTWGSLFGTNTVYDNSSRGLSVTNTYGSGQTVVSGNIAYDNTAYGIEVSGDILATGNQAYGHVGTNDVGIIAGGDAEVRDNLVHGNYIGIMTNHTALVVQNRVYNNSFIGIDARYHSDILGNQVYSNGIGIRTYWWSSARFYGEVRNNVVYDNSDHGIQVGATGAGSIIANNTVYQLVGDAIHVQDSSTSANIRSNILVVDSGRGIFVANDSQVDFQADYNLYHLTGTGIIGNWEGIDFTTRADWFYELGLEEHGKIADPLLVDPDGADGTLGYEAGTDFGLDDDFHVPPSSPAVDAGDPLDYYLNEIDSGGRVNIGAYGNTDEAAGSPDELAQVMSPNGLEKYELNQAVTIDWRSFGLTFDDAVMLTNAGADGTVGYWLYDRHYSTGSTTYTTTTITTVGVTDPAPMEVYQTYRQADSSIGGTLDYHLTVPDGTYTLRLHFAEHQYNSVGSRVFDIFVQGVLEIDDYDIRADAGAMYTATTQTFAITAAGGAGIDIQFVNETNARAILAGIELTQATAAGVASPTVDIDVSTDSGGSWTPIAVSQSMDVHGRGSYAWAADPTTSGNTALIRVRANDASMPTDESDETFLIANDGTDYYINDASTVGDVMTSAAGDNAVDGKTPATPMRSLRALISAYDLDTGDIIHVDTGTHQIIRDIYITASDAGVTVEGPDIALALFDRANTTHNVFNISGSDITLRYLSITGGEDGVSAVAATGLTVDQSDIYGNDDYGIYLDGTSHSATITTNLVHDNLREGIYSYGADELVVTGNEVYASANRGVYVYSSYGTLIDGNTVYDNSSYGMEVGGVTGQPITTVSNNVVYDNAGAYGMYVYTNLLASGNTVYGHTATNHWGMYVASAEARENEVFGNYNGIVTDTYGVVVDNRVYNNANIGIHTYYGSHVIGNHVYSNSIGIKTDWWSSARFTGRVENNLIYANSNYGLLIEGGGTGAFANNTIYQEVGDAIRVQDSGNGVYIESNILWVADGYAIWVDTNSEPGFHSDYNLFHITGVGKLGTWQDIEFLSAEDWRYELGLDQNSRFGDPLFVDIDGADDVLGYDGGDFGLDDDFHILPASPAVDGGDPDAMYLTEPDSGGRINIGRYGDTTEAAASPDEVVHVLSPNGFEKLELAEDVTIEWIGWGLGTVNTLATINSGNAGAIGQWAADQYYVDGSTSSFTSVVDTSGVTNPAPMEVYQSYRRAASSGVGNTLNYQIPVPDGVYTLRLHFAEPSYTGAGSRVFDILAEGLLEVDDFDIAASAGGRYIATTATISVTAVGGDGITLTFVNETSAYAIVSAIELTEAAGGVPSPTVDIDLSTDSGGSWSSIATGVATGVFGRGSYLWAAGPLTPTNEALIRVTANDGTMPTDQSDNTFLIANNGTDYYINDAFTAGDVLMTAVGDDAADGKTAATPMATLWSLINAYTLEAGDVVHIDTGDYRVFRNIEITPSDAAAVFQGETGATAMYDRMYQYRNVFDITGSDTSLVNLRITGGEDGVSVIGATGVAVSQSEIFENDDYGIYL
ncbi:MAG: right-handed parallel beta-helix repeat-containing protein, partial [Phycisphaerales bacterium]|nr:right-handed parallel beta-helix repeat-containing protein [Phycisphaerales bacterium]